MSGHPNRILALVLGAIAVVVVVAAVVASQRDVTTYSTDTPVGVVQAYVAAVVDGDTEQAYGHLDGDQCTIEEVDQAYVPDDIRVVLREEKVTGDTAMVQVDIVTGTGGPLGDSEYAEKQTFRLGRSGDTWVITGTPWPMYVCGMEK